MRIRKFEMCENIEFHTYTSYRFEIMQNPRHCGDDADGEISGFFFFLFPPQCPYCRCNPFFSRFFTRFNINNRITYWPTCPGLDFGISVARGRPAGHV